MLKVFNKVFFFLVFKPVRAIYWATLPKRKYHRIKEINDNFDDDNDPIILENYKALKNSGYFTLPRKEEIADAPDKA